MKEKTLDIIYCGIFATITAILSQIAIPMPGGVPLTLQTFAVSLVGILLGSRKGFISMSVYVLMGAIGLPVFSGFSAGVGAIVGPTGGFILSFPIMSFIIGLVCERTDNKVIIFLGMLIASTPNYLVGAIQFSLVTSTSIYDISLHVYAGGLRNEQGGTKGFRLFLHSAGKLSTAGALDAGVVNDLFRDVNLATKLFFLNEQNSVT